mmetsp:Transcript_11171/g.41760  ORF Transcript_11171/g.41760 Transcript_11171/m.41760 type:complete len:112 (+) Transcript_11171:5778-6113(+)
MSVCGEKSAWKCEVRSGEVFCVENLTSFQKSKMTACSSFSEFHQHTSFHFQPFLNNPSISKLKSLFESSSTQLSHLLNSHASPTSGKYSQNLHSKSMFQTKTRIFHYTTRV